MNRRANDLVGYSVAAPIGELGSALELMQLRPIPEEGSSVRFEAFS